MRIKISVYCLEDYAVPDRVKITRYGGCKEHNTLEELYRFKGNLKLRKLAGREAKKKV